MRRSRGALGYLGSFVDNDKARYWRNMLIFLFSYWVRVITQELTILPRYSYDPSNNLIGLELFSMITKWLFLMFNIKIPKIRSTHNITDIRDCIKIKNNAKLCYAKSQNTDEFWALNKECRTDVVVIQNSLCIIQQNITILNLNYEKNIIFIKIALKLTNNHWPHPVTNVFRNPRGLSIAVALKMGQSPSDLFPYLLSKDEWIVSCPYTITPLWQPYLQNGGDRRATKAGFTRDYTQNHG